ncbi:hypothetical protein LKK83_01945, partial [Phormidium sp. CCY1219]|nr:hypothetical protein [Phormidium sp. CCY1219]
MVQESPKGSDNKPELNSRGNLGKVVDAPGSALDSHPKGTEEPKRLLPGWVTVLLVISAIATGGYSLYTLFQMGYGRNESSPLSSLSTPEPIQFVAALGRLEPEGEVIQLSASTSQPAQRVSELLVEEGDNVRADQVVAIMNDRDRLSAELESAQQQVKIAQAQLAQVKSGAKTGEIAAQEATVARLEAQIPRDIEMQNATIARVQAQVQGDVTAQDATIARVQAQVQGDIQAQQARIERLQAELEEQVNAQQATINRLQAELEGQKTAAQATVNRLQAQVRGDVEAQQATVNRL